MKILVGGAWVYANGSLHIGHVAGLLPGDIIARYYRQRGEEVSYISGSDCHGTPITIKAKKTGESPEAISDRYHEEFVKGFDYLGFSYDHYGKTSSDSHKSFVRDFHRKLYESPYIVEKEEPQAYCPSCQKFLADRLLEGTCPHCNGVTKGEQCDHCHEVLQGNDLIEPRCRECHSQPEFIQEKHLYLTISKLDKHIRHLLEKAVYWRKNALDFTKRYLDDGLRDRAITRNLDWGIDVPKEGYDQKKIYIWAENVLGYLSGNKLHCDRVGLDWKDYWSGEAKRYFVHGKDNIPFHTIILPSLLKAHGAYDSQPHVIVSSEHLTLEGSKISTSNDWALWVNDLIESYNPDTIRYYLTTIYPQRRDSDFSSRELKYANNSELLGGYGNFVNRVLKFVERYYKSEVPRGDLNPALTRKIEVTYEKTGKAIEVGNVKTGIQEAFELVRFANKYFDENKPWITIKNERDIADNTIAGCIYLIINLAQILKPFIPFSSEKLEVLLGFNSSWQIIEPDFGRKLEAVKPLFERLE